VQLQKANRNFRFSSLTIFLVLALSSILLSFIISRFGLAAGIICLALIIGLPILLFIISKTEFGFFIVLVLSFFMSFIYRYTGGLVPFIMLEIILFVVLLGIVFKEMRNPRTTSSLSDYFKNPIAIVLIIWVIYNHLQLFNPNSSEIMGKIVAIRQSSYTLIGFFIALYIFRTMKVIKTFFTTVLGLSLLAALYGLSQKYIGLLPFEKNWLYADPLGPALFVIWGELRAWSFLSDPSNFGILMASSGTICFILLTGPIKLKNKIILGISGAAMLLAMVSSGTRTAFIAVLVGFGIFGLINITNLRTQIISVLALLTFLTVYFGPFYSAPVIRIRSAFEGKEDPSMNVRLINKERIRPYLLTHPFGGGPNTTGNTKAVGHPLAGFPPDSGYLRIGLELGYIGLFLILLVYYQASSQLVSNYFQTYNQEKKTLYLAILCSMLGFCTAELTQITINQKPVDFLFFSYFALIIRLKSV
jgi:putative inorganic carbon (hco3(-)) transporter